MQKAERRLRPHLALIAVAVVAGFTLGCDLLPFGKKEEPIAAAPPIPVAVPAQPALPAQPAVPVAQPAVPGEAPKQPNVAQPTAVVVGKPNPPAQPRQARPRVANGTCLNTCQYANDGECDDGRANSHTSLCGAGTDCNDCGAVGRRFSRSQNNCTNTCQHANDGECDDGRTNAHTSLCAAGTDCNDCGPVGRAFNRGGSGATGAAAGSGCTNTCQHANDGECDDGRPGSITSLCGAGTDCADCGPVP